MSPLYIFSYILLYSHHMNKAKVIEEHKTNYVILDNETDYIATVRGSFFKQTLFPKVGDIVSYSEVSSGKAVIEEVMPRTSTIIRKEIETDSEQVIVANVDIIFVVMGLDGDFNLSRLERYLLLAKQSGVLPVIVLNKCDVVDDLDTYVSQTKDVAGKVPVHAVSAVTGENMESLLTHINPDTTAVLLGSSGAGKSTITNWLLNEDKQDVKEVRAHDSRGRHTTTFRQLFSLPTGGFLIDTPGMRELGIKSDVEEEDIVFEQIDTLSKQCRFSNCDHEKSLGCAILKAIEDEVISERQLNNYHKIQRERQHEESKHNKEISREMTRKQKNLRKNYRVIEKTTRFGKQLD